MIRVMTFNIRNSNGDRGTVHDWDNRKEKVINVINKNGPNVIGFQEVLGDQLKFLVEKLPSYDHVGIGRDDGGNEGESRLDSLSF